MNRSIEEDATIDASAAPPGRDAAAPPPQGERADGPVPLDGLVYGIDGLDALLVFHLGDAHLHAAWVRADAGFRAEEPVSSLRDAYRVAQFAGRRLGAFGAAADARRGDVASPLVTLEIPSRTALLRRVRAHVVAALFDA
ncbi:MAG TPA: hypothetical protein VHB21_03695, partial [Minicystis sp.]|nr:hypothetical protein [Minicystis sp.]